MESWLLMQTFYHGLTNSIRETIDAAAGGVFLSLTLSAMTTLVEKMASYQGWNEERVHTHKKGRGMHQLNEVDMLSAKMDLLMKKLEERANEKKEVMHINDSHMTCEEYGNIEHLGNNYPEIQEDVNFVNNNYYRPQQNQGCNQQQSLNCQGNYKVTLKVTISITSINHP
jgi:hypothetical protein